MSLRRFLESLWDGESLRGKEEESWKTVWCPQSEVGMSPERRGGWGGRPWQRGEQDLGHGQTPNLGFV